MTICGPSSSRSWPRSRSRPGTSGCELGAITARARPRPRGLAALYPDTYEVGLPNQGLQILYEILNERADAVAERSYAPWIDLEARAAGHRPAAVLGRHPPPGRPTSTSSPSTSPPSSSTPTSSTASTSPASRSASAERTGEHPIVIAGGHCAYNPEPLADFVDAFVLGDGEEVVGEITEVIGAWKAGGRTEASRRDCLRALANVTGVYVPDDVRRRSTTAPTSSPSSRPRSPTSPRWSRSAPSPTWPSGRTRSTSSCRSSRSSTTASTSRSSGAAPGAAASARRG